MEKVLELLRANPEGMTSAEVALALGWSPAIVASTLCALKRRALIQSAGKLRSGAAVVSARSRPLQLNFFRMRYARSPARKALEAATS